MSRYEPWSLLNQLQRELERSYENKTGGSESVATAEWTPAVDIKEEVERYLLWADVPGVPPDAIEIMMEDGILTLRGRRSTEAAERGAGLKRAERVSGEFYRRFSLPDTADAEGISARCQNGVLEISIPKKAANKPRKIQVMSETG